MTVQISLWPYFSTDRPFLDFAPETEHLTFYSGLGILFGYIGAFITKYTIHVRIIEPTFVFVICFCSYLTAECLDLSAILGKEILMKFSEKFLKIFLKFF